MSQAQILPAYSYIPHARAGEFPPNYLPPAPSTVASIPPSGVRLQLTTTSLRNVVLASASDSIYYECSTPADGHVTTLTRVKLLVGQEPRYTQVAQLDARPHQPLKIRLNEERTWWPARALLKFDPSRCLGEFTGDDGHTYRWTVHPKSRRLQVRRSTCDSSRSALTQTRSSTPQTHPRRSRSPSTTRRASCYRSRGTRPLSKCSLARRPSWTRSSVRPAGFDVRVACR